MFVTAFSWSSEAPLLEGAKSDDTARYREAQQGSHVEGLARCIYIYIYIYTCIYVYIYIYIYRERER